jgi:hypothetical protein
MWRMTLTAGLLRMVTGLAAMVSSGEVTVTADNGAQKKTLRH